MLYDKHFLRQLDENRTKTIYARIIALQLDETPVETIEGRVTQGSINIDGSSAVRRTCSLTIVAQNYDYNNFLWGLNTKFKLEIGLENQINSSYPEIIWFKQGTYFISSFNASRSTNNFTINIQGKDKMCGLNGEIGGSFSTAVDLGTMEEIDTNGDIRFIKIPIKDIIRNLVSVYGNEPVHNIIINDLDMTGLELLEYRFDRPMYLWRDAKDGSQYTNITLDGAKECAVGTEKKHLEELDGELEMLVSPLTGSEDPTVITIDGVKVYMTKISFGDTAGYRSTDLTYPGDLIANIGESITSVLDKIKNILGDFEYFYNLDGQFVFQRKRAYINSHWSPEKKDTDGNIYVNMEEEISYTFNNGYLVTAFNNNPNISNLRNDFSVSGERVGISGQPIAVHMRYAIDRKPKKYNSINVTKEIKNDDVIEVSRDPALIAYNNKYGTNVDGQDSWTYIANNRYYIDNTNKITYCDWREIIYQMAKDYYKYGHILSDFETRLIAANSELSFGKTGYENYYSDLISKSNWRWLYNPTLKPDDEGYDNYCHTEDSYNHWNKTVYAAPQNLNFWFDFLDDSALSQYDVKNIGCRPKSINDSSVKAIYFRETPSVLFIDNTKEEGIKPEGNYTKINIPPAYMNTMFSISAQGQAAKDKIDELLYTHTCCTESATITTVPIYYLEPNTKIRIIDEDTKLDGYYMIDKMTIPLSYNGTMSITATKVVEGL